MLPPLRPLTIEIEFFALNQAKGEIIGSELSFNETYEIAKIQINM